MFGKLEACYKPAVRFVKVVRLCRVLSIFLLLSGINISYVKFKSRHY